MEDFVAAQLHEEYPTGRHLGHLSLLDNFDDDDDSIQADIVAVQGLGSSYEWTWSVDDPTSRTGRFNWLREKLPKDVPNARILAFEYDSRWYQNPSFGRLEDHGQSLLDCLIRHRFPYGDSDSSTKKRRRPLILIGHSFGGLVIKQALVLAAQSHPSDDDEVANRIYKRHRNLLSSITGVIFLGTPHRGTTFTLFAYLKMAVGRMRGRSSNKELVAVLSVDSPTLVYVGNQFSGLLEDDRLKNLQIYSYFEEREVPWLGQRVVGPGSACLDRSRPRGMECNHMEMNKFYPGVDPRYDRVLEDLREVLEDSEETIRRRTVRWEYNNEASNINRKNLRQWLNPSDEVQIREQAHRLSEHRSAPFTCHWIQSNPEFLQWRDRPTYSNSLWINGTAGSGKSILSAFLIDLLQNPTNQLTGTHTLFDDPLRSSSGQVKLPVLYFICGVDRALETPWSFVGTLIHQAIAYFDRDDDLFELANKARKDHGRIHGSASRDWRHLAGVLHRIGQALGELCIVVDGLEELSNFGEILNAISFVKQLAGARILILSQNLKGVRKHIESILGQPLTLSITDHSAEDIAKFASLRVEQLVDERPDFSDRKAHITNTLQRSSDGIFEWLNDIVKYLQSDLVEATNLDENLLDLPIGLPSMYEKILRRIHTKYPAVNERIRNALQWLSVSGRPLSVRELRLAMSFSLKTDAHELGQKLLKDRQLIANFDNAEEDMSRMLSSLVKINNMQDGEQYVQLVHPSLRVVLSDLAHRSDDPTLSAFQFDLESAHKFCAHVCMMICGETTMAFAQRQEGSQIRLIEYAWSYWSYHQRLCKADLSDKMSHELFDQMFARVCRDTVIFLGGLIDFASSPIIQLPLDGLEGPRGKVSLQQAQDSLLPAMRALSEARNTQTRALVAFQLQHDIKYIRTALISASSPSADADPGASKGETTFESLKSRFTVRKSSMMELTASKTIARWPCLASHQFQDSKAMWNLSQSLRLVAIRFAVEPIVSALQLVSKNPGFSPVVLLARVANFAEECGNLPFWVTKVLPTSNLDYSACFLCPPGDIYFGPARFVLEDLIGQKRSRIVFTDDRMQIRRSPTDKELVPLGDEHKMHVMTIHQMPGENFIVANYVYGATSNHYSRDPYRGIKEQVQIWHMQNKLRLKNVTGYSRNPQELLAQYRPQDMALHEYEYQIKALPQLFCMLYIQYIWALLQACGKLSQQILAMHALRLEIAKWDVVHVVGLYAALREVRSKFFILHLLIGVGVFWLREKYIPWWSAVPVPHPWKELFLGLRHPAAFLNVDVSLGFWRMVLLWGRFAASEAATWVVMGVSISPLVEGKALQAQSSAMTHIGSPWIIFMMLLKVQRAAISFCYALVTLVTTGIVMFSSEETAGGVVTFTIWWWLIVSFNIGFNLIRAGFLRGHGPWTQLGAMLLQLALVFLVIRWLSKFANLLRILASPITLPIYYAVKAALYIWLPLLRVSAVSALVLGTGLAAIWAHQYFHDPYNIRQSLRDLCSASGIVMSMVGRESVQTLFQIANPDGIPAGVDGHASRTIANGTIHENTSDGPTSQSNDHPGEQVTAGASANADLSPEELFQRFFGGKNNNNAGFPGSSSGNDTAQKGQGHHNVHDPNGEQTTAGANAGRSPDDAWTQFFGGTNPVGQTIIMPDRKRAFKFTSSDKMVRVPLPMPSDLGTPASTSGAAERVDKVRLARVDTVHEKDE